MVAEGSGEIIDIILSLEINPSIPLYIWSYSMGQHGFFSASL